MNCRWVLSVLVAGTAWADADFRTAPPSSTSSMAAVGAPRTSPTGRVVQGDGLEDAALSRVVKANKLALDGCIARAKHRDPAAEGRIYVTFEITPDGATRAVVAEDAVLRDALVDACLVDQVKTWTFPKTSDGKPVQVRLPVAVGVQLGALTGGPDDQPRRPVLVDEAPPMQGALDTNVIRRSQPAIRRCYVQALKAQPDLSLKLAVGFTVGKDGKVSDVKLDGLPAEQRDLSACLTAVLNGLVFAPPEGVVTVRYPFTFMPPK